MEDVELSISLSAEWHNVAPSYKLYVDDILIGQGKVTELKSNKETLTIDWTGQLAEGDHLIRLQMFDKTINETIVDHETNKILKDQLIYIDDICLDQIDLGYLCFKLGRFYPNKSIRPDLDDVIPNLTCIGFNGEWQLKFTVPTYLWLLEHF